MCSGQPIQKSLGLLYNIDRKEWNYTPVKQVGVRCAKHIKVRTVIGPPSDLQPMKEACIPLYLVRPKQEQKIDNGFVNQVICGTVCNLK